MSRRPYLALAVAPFLIAPVLDASLSDRVLACARREAGESQPIARPMPAPNPAPAPVTVPAPVTAPVVEKKLDPKQALKAWLEKTAPQGATVVEDGPGLELTHTAKQGDTIVKLAAAYIDLTTLYAEHDLVTALLRANPKAHLGNLTEGTKLRIPHVVTSVPLSPEEGRLGWPADKSMRGLYANATMAGAPSFPSTLDKMAAHGMNAIVVDAKDVTGFFTYPTKIPLALEVDGNKHVTIGSLDRLVRVAHARGIRVIARVACFRDERMGPRKGELAIKSKQGTPHRAPSNIVDWLDPTNEVVQSYLLDVVDESIAAGVDEVQLDYVRYPTEGIWDADFHLAERKLTTVSVITDFVKRIHEHTSKAKVPLSLDIFGVVAWRFPRDIEATGQDIQALAPHVEALSPMVYPSHFAVGFNGYEIPGDHADIVAIGTKRAVNEILALAKIDSTQGTTVIRPWVQAFPWKSPNFGSPYIADQIKEAKNGGGVGWLAWNSGGEYGATFGAVPVVAHKTLLASK